MTYEKPILEIISFGDNMVFTDTIGTSQYDENTPGYNGAWGE